METLHKIISLIGDLSTMITVIIILIKPVRNRVLDFGSVISGMKCLLRADMLRIYYKNHASDTIPQHERENFESEYRAYKALGGNSFIDDVYQEIKKWEVIL